MQSRDFKKTQSAFVHGFRYNVRLLSRFLKDKYEESPLTFRAVEKCPKHIAQSLLDRVNSNSGLWQQNGFLCDVVAVSEDENVRYIEELLLDYVHNPRTL